MALDPISSERVSCGRCGQLELGRILETAVGRRSRGINPRTLAEHRPILATERFPLCRRCERRFFLMGVLRRLAVAALPALGLLGLAVGLVRTEDAYGAIGSAVGALVVGVATATFLLLRWYRSREAVLRQLAFEARRSKIARGLGCKPEEIAFYPPMDER